jgi:hypothetical protein
VRRAAMTSCTTSSAKPGAMYAKLACQAAMICALQPDKRSSPLLHMPGTGTRHSARLANIHTAPNKVYITVLGVAAHLAAAIASAMLPSAPLPS